MPSLLQAYDPTKNQYICQQLVDYTARHIGQEWAHQDEHLAFYLEDDRGALRGGLVAHITWGVLHIKHLWVHPDYRGKGYGRQLIEKAEEAAHKHKCRGLQLETADYLAPAFYEKMGFTLSPHYFKGTKTLKPDTIG